MYNVLNDIQLSKNFRLSEFECHDGSHEIMLDMRLIDALQKLRNTLGVPMTIAAGYRNPKHNAEIGGDPDSMHLLGMAADVKTTLKPKTVAIAAKAIGFTGIGVCTNNGSYYIHLDVRQAAPSYWTDVQGSTKYQAVKTIEEIRG